MEQKPSDKIARKILVADDEPAVCNMLKKFLIQKGYDVSIALNGEETLAKAKAEKPWAVLLDIRMPDIDGIEVLRRLREIDKKVPIIIMVTAVNDAEVGRMCINFGASDYITKPITLEYLETVLTMKLLEV
jgi:DNA-binding response OmpR family regulator